MKRARTRMGIRLAACLAALPAFATAANAQPAAEAGIVAEINRARADPAGYARELRRYRTYYRGRDGSSPAERIRRRGGGLYGASGEVIAYGPEDAASFVRELIIDDGVPDRGHRTLLFSPRFRFAGAACGRHPGWRYMCVVDFSDSVPGR